MEIKSLIVPQNKSIMIRCLLSSCLLFYFMLMRSNAQEYSSKEQQLCNTAEQANYLTNVEKEVIYYINLLRQNPSLYKKKYLAPWIQQHEIKSNAYTKSILTQLNNTKPLELITPRQDLFEIASNHSTDMGTHGMEGHTASNGLTFEQRTKHLYSTYKFLLENCQYGYEDALSIVNDLLIDEDVPSLGHRKALLNKDVRYIGVAVMPHNEFRFNTTMDIAGDLIK